MKKQKLQANSYNLAALIKMADFLSNINLRAFPYLSLVVVTLCFLEAFTYPGFLSKHFVVSLLDMAFIYVISGYVAGNTFLYLSKNSKDKFFRNQFDLLKNMYVLVLPTILLLIAISHLSLPRQGTSLIIRDDFLLFPSRIFSGIMVIIYFLWVHFYFLEGKFKKIFNLLKIKNIIILFLSATFFWALLLSFKINIKSIIFNINSVLSGIYTYEQKMESQIGPVYNYYKFINKYTPEKSLIMHPKQQGQWGDVSNEGFTRYFVYPRDLISEEVYLEDKKNIDYIMLIGDQKLSDKEHQNRWPNFDVAAKRIVLYPFEDGLEPIILYSDYYYDDFEYKSYWGLIEVDKERIKW